MNIFFLIITLNRPRAIYRRLEINLLLSSFDSIEGMFTCMFNSVALSFELRFLTDPNLIYFIIIIIFIIKKILLLIIKYRFFFT